MRFGIATVDITPPFPTTMAGYGARVDRYDDVHDPLTFTALVLEERGRRAFVGAADLLTFDDDQAVALREQLAARVECPVDSVLLNASHTHGGPDVKSIPAYREFLGKQVLAAVEAALGDMQPGSLWYGIGTSEIPRNRRLERDGMIVNAPNREGPVDNRVQLLALKDAHGDLRALGVRLSCHPVATGAQHRITADYPGAFRKACRRAFGVEVAPFFLQGAGGDMRPAQADDGDRWRYLPHDELSDIGQALLADCLRVLVRGELTKLAALSLRGKLQVARVPCQRLYARPGALERLEDTGGALERGYVQKVRERLAAGQPPPDEVEVATQAVWLTKDTVIVGIQGEVLIGLGAYVEKTLAPNRVLLLGYSNGCVGYLPDTKELRRGGYEQTSYLYQGWSGPFKPGVEKVLAAAVWRRK